MAYRMGARNFNQIKEEILKEKIFMFDYYLKGIKPSLLGKRILSLIKMMKGKDVSHLSISNEDSSLM